MRYITYFIIFLVFFNRDNAECDFFSASGRRDSLCIVYFFDKLHIAANFNSSSIRLLSGGLRPNLARILYFITKFDILLTSLLFSFYIIVQGSIPFSRVKRKRTQNRVRFLLERETGFGPATSTLARWHSTTESLPHIMLFNKHSTVLSPFFEVFLTSVSRRVHLPS